GLVATTPMVGASDQVPARGARGVPEQVGPALGRAAMVRGDVERPVGREVGRAGKILLDAGGRLLQDGRDTTSGIARSGLTEHLDAALVRGQGRHGVEIGIAGSSDLELAGT